jgi:hypothetical protein
LWNSVEELFCVLSSARSNATSNTNDPLRCENEYLESR